MDRCVAPCAAEALLAQEAEAVLRHFDERAAVLPAHVVRLRCALDGAEGDRGAFRGKPRRHVAEAEVVVHKLVSVVERRVVGDGDEGGRGRG